MPVDEHDKSKQVKYDQPARFLNLRQRKQKMGKESENSMTEEETIYEIIHIFTRPEISGAKRFKMLCAIEKIAAMPDAHKPDEPEPNDANGA